MILVTGSDGFVGRHLCNFFVAEGKEYFPVVRSVKAKGEFSGKDYAIGDIGPNTDWSGALKGVEVVVHLAAKVHAFGRSSLDVGEFRRVNVDGSVNLARQAAESGVRRFVYVSTIKVHGEETRDVPFRPDDMPSPVDAYSSSKLEAEKRLAELCSVAGMELVVLRPPLMYGKGVKGNFEKLVKLVNRGYWLPFGSIHNKRSLIGVENFCSLINSCIEHTEAPGKIFLASDGQDVSTPDIIRLIAKYTNKPLRLVPVPVQLLHFMATLTGMHSKIRKLTGNLQVDSIATQRILDWTPPHTIEKGIEKCF